MKKYEPLGNYLAGLPATQESVTLTFGKIEEIIGATLPDSAHDRRPWWANQDYGSRAYHWENAGFKVDKVDQARRVVTFRRAQVVHSRRGRSADTAAARALEEALREVNRRAGQEEGLGSGRFTQALNRRGGLGAARRLLQPLPRGATLPGFDAILAAGRADLTMEYVVLQDRFRQLFTPAELAEAQRRLGWIADPTVASVAEAVEEGALGRAFGDLQQLRQRLKRKNRLPSRRLFHGGAKYERWTYHVGGRTELQFNIGFEEAGDGRRYMRHGVAISLQRDQSVHEIDDAMLARIRRFNAYIEANEDAFPEFLMYDAYDDGTWSGDYAVREITPDVVKLGAFIFIGRRQDPAAVSATLILRDFERLLPLYEFVEDPDVAARVPPPPTDHDDEFIPGLTRRPSRTRMSLAARELDKDLRHNDIQYALGRYLRRRHGKDKVRAEYGTRSGMRVDLCVKNGEDDYTFYEIKTAWRA